MKLVEKFCQKLFSVNWVKWAAVLGSLNQHSFLSVTDSENRICWDLKGSQVIYKTYVQNQCNKTQLYGEKVYVFAINAHALNFYFLAKALEDKTNLFKMQI